MNESPSEIAVLWLLFVLSCHPDCVSKGDKKNWFIVACFPVSSLKRCYARLCVSFQLCVVGPPEGSRPLQATISVESYIT